MKLTESEKAICKIYLEEHDKNGTCNEYKLLMRLIEESGSEETPDKRTETHPCVYCNENECGFVKPIEKNSHTFVHRGMFEWNLVRAKGWKASVPINFCPMCGRRLER